MKLLLDTHVWIWSQEVPERLGPTATEFLTDLGNDLLISPISTLEIARLIEGGRIQLNGTLRHWVKKSMELLLAQSAEFNHNTARKTYELNEPFHRDPADRILVATAQIEKCRLLTADERILAYPHVKTMNAEK
ncbi:MAG TPA: type II toxin-antitoxin system VapC family toxin [Tichowtungia sp.]|nr:type II toxin-antitoxin system VapC family toxin [Tichowtungia sp.]